MNSTDPDPSSPVVPPSSSTQPDGDAPTREAPGAATEPAAGAPSSAGEAAAGSGDEPRRRNRNRRRGRRNRADRAAAGVLDVRVVEAVQDRVRRHVVERQRRGGDLGELDEADQLRLLVTVGELAGGRREQEERQDEQSAGEVDQHLGPHPAGLRGLEGDQDDQRVLEDVVVERAEELRREERSEPAFGEQSELATVRHCPRAPPTQAFSRT